MTDNIKSDQSAKIAHTTQAELDEIMDKIYDLAYDHLPERGITIGTNRIKQATIDWHNKQTEELLDRLESQSRRADECTDDTLVVKMIRVGAERDRLNKLKEVK